MFLPYFLRMVCLAIGFILIPKPDLNPYLLNRRRIEMLMIVITIAMYLWAFLIIPLINITSTNLWTFVMMISSQAVFFVLLYLTLFSTFFHGIQSWKGSFNFIIAAIIFQLMGTLIYGIELVLSIYPGGGIGDIFFLSSSLLMALAGISYLKYPDLNVVRERKLNLKSTLLSNLISLLAASVFLAVIWGYFFNNESFLFILLASGLLILLAIIRQAVNNKYINITQDLLRNSEKKFRAIYEHAKDGIIIMDKQREIISWNNGAEEIFGFKSHEIVGKDANIVIPSEYEERFASLLNRHEGLNDYNTVENNLFEAEGLNKKGERFPLEFSISHWYNDDNVLLYAFIVRDITERKEHEEKIRNSLAEKEVLLKEIHHRVKNNLQIVSSLLNIESRYIENENDLKIIREGMDRVHAMALIHKNLYESSDLSNVLFAQHVESLLSEIFSSYVLGQNVDLKLDIEEIQLDIDQIIPYSLIINELVTNSLKYAFPDGMGKIFISLHSDAEKIVLTVSDNGIGLPEGFDIKKTRSLGLRLVRVFTRQLKGIMVINQEDGLSFKIISPYKKFDDT
ncbi:MAG: sensor histidine kinase [Methanomicrobiales archaeon]